MLKTIGRLILRFLLLNAILFATAFVLTILHQLLHNLVTSSYVGNPYQLYIVAFILSNLIYCIGMTFDWFYHRLWNKPFKVRVIEKTYFKAAIAMASVVYGYGVVSFLIEFFK